MDERSFREGPIADSCLPYGYTEDRGDFIPRPRTERKRGSRSNRSGRSQEAVGALELPAVKFRATLSGSRQPLSFGQDGEGKVTFEVAASEVAELVKLLLYRNRVFTVIIEGDDIG